MYKGLAILALICFLIAALGLLFLYIKFSINEKKVMEEKLAQTEADIAKVKKQSEKYSQEKKENEELVQKINSSDTLASADASIELLQKLSDKGKERNKY